MKIFLRGLELPAKVRGVTVQDEEGNFNIYINTLLCDDAKEKAYKHEMKHIELMHLQDFNPVILNELEASC